MYMSCYIYSRENFVLSTYLGIVFPYAIYERAKITTTRKARIKLRTDLPYGKSTEELMWLLMRECSKTCILLLKCEAFTSKSQDTNVVTYNKPLKLLNIMHTIPALPWLIILVISLENLFETANVSFQCKALLRANSEPMT